MFADTQGARQRWFVAAVAGAITGVAAVSLFRLPAIIPLEPTAPGRTIQLREATPEHALLSEEAAMRDLAPLFLPTDRNATLRRLPTREPGRTFLDVETPRLGIADSGWRFERSLLPLATIEQKAVSAATPLDYLRATAEDVSLVGFGRAPQPVPVARPRGAILEVVRLRDGLVVHSSLMLGPEVRPPTDKVWQPLEFTANVGAAGLVAPLTVSARSGVDEVDTFFRNYLAQSFRIGERLTPGLYRISVAP